jgi:hypothetical protein
MSFDYATQIHIFASCKVRGDGDEKFGDVHKTDDYTDVVESITRLKSTKERRA